MKNVVKSGVFLMFKSDVVLETFTMKNLKIKKAIL